jgi:HNH endonuclease
MVQNLLGERWKTIDFNSKLESDNRIDISNLGRLRSFNERSNGDLINGSLINGYKIIRLKFFEPRDADTERKFAYHQKQIAKFTLKLRLMKTNKESKTAINEASALLEELRLNHKKKLGKDWTKRATNYHSLVHRLVANYFLKKTTANQTIVAHLDYDKLNNRASNLKWMTPAENIIHQSNSPHVIADKVLRRTGAQNSGKITKLTVTKVMLLKKLLNEGKSLKALAKQFKVSDTQILRIKRGENWGDISAAK